MTKVMDKQFLIILAAVTIVGFSTSTYIFSQVNVDIEIDGLSDNLSAKKAQIIDEVNRCLSQNTVAGGSITLNSFERNLLSNITQQVENADDVKTLENISEQFYTMTSCKRE